MRARLVRWVASISCRVPAARSTTTPRSPVPRRVGCAQAQRTRLAKASSREGRFMSGGSLQESVDQPGDFPLVEQGVPAGHGGAWAAVGDGGNQGIAGFAGKGLGGDGGAESAGEAQAVAGATVLQKKMFQLAPVDGTVGRRSGKRWKERHEQGGDETRQSRSAHDDVLLTAYFRDRIHSARVLASASETAFGGMGIGPQTPWLPLLMWVARVSAAPATPAFLAAISLRAGPAIFMSTLWHAAQGLLLNSASPSAARAGCRLMAAPRASIGSRTFFICGVPYKAKEAGSDPASRGAPQYTSC